MTANDPVIQTNQLSKSYGKVQAVRDLDLSVQPGRITAFLGMNGAGKSTTIRMLLGMIQPSSGDGRVLDKRISDPAESMDMRRRVAYVSENKRLYDYMTVEQIIRFTRSFYPDWRSEVERKLVSDFGLPLDRKIKSLSKGMRTKLALLLAFARRPELLILDEPSEGLDPIGVEQMLEGLIGHCSEGTAVFFSSHQISEVEPIADHVCVLHHGALVVDASMDDIRQTYRQIDLVFPSLPDERDIRLAGVESIRTRGRQMTVFVSRNTESVIERARALSASSVETSAVSLREIFLETVRER
jgi:ABC-2 type transport system ATP-binding protein